MLLHDYEERIELARQNDEDLLQWLSPSKDLAKRRSKLREVIRSLPSYEAYKTACEAVYGV